MMAMAAPRPKSPPASPDPCGRHRLQHAVDTLHREIGFLEGEINSIEGVHAASKCCKEVDEFIGKNADPFITISSKKGTTDQSHHFSKKFRARTCLRSYLSWICCCGGCSSFQFKGPPSCSSSCGSALERLCRCYSRGSSCRCRRCRVGCGGCCPCPRCSSCSTCPTTCSAACCVPRCCPCS